MGKSKKVEKTEKVEKNNSKFFVLTNAKLNLGHKLLEPNKMHEIDEKTANSLKQTNFFKKGSIEIIEA